MAQSGLRLRLRIWKAACTAHGPGFTPAGPWATAKGLKPQAAGRRTVTLSHRQQVPRVCTPIAHYKAYLLVSTPPHPVSSPTTPTTTCCDRGMRSVTLTNPPISLPPDIAALLWPETDIKVKHGPIGLLKYLACAAPARTPLSQVGIVEQLVASNIFQPSADTAEMVQVNAIGVMKHLCIGDGKSCHSCKSPQIKSNKTLSVLETKT